MSIKAIVNKCTTTEKSQFPRLITHTNRMILLVRNDDGDATVIFRGTSDYSVGYTDRWSAWKADSFFDFNGSVTLQNE